jgi:hypothetical protein
MQQPAPDLESWLECSSGSLTEANRDLCKRLRLLSAEAGQPDSGNAAARAYYKIHRAIQALISQKRLDERIRARDDEVKGIWRRRRGTEDWLVCLVRTKAYELGIGHRRCGREEAARLAQQDFKIDEGERRVIWKESDLGRVEQRALAIVNSARRVAKKNFLERRAIKLADAVIGEWFSPRGKRGRPAGSKIGLVSKAIGGMQLASVTEAIAVVLPIIEQLAGPRRSPSINSTIIGAVVSALHSAGLTCTSELAARAISSLRRASRPPTI